MKKTLLTIATVSTLALFACKDKAKEGNAETTSATEQTKASEETKSATNEPKTYKVTFTPDTLYLGKSKELFVKIKNAKAVALQDQDGKSEGIEFSYDLELTNKNQVGGNSVFFTPSESRLTLDNGNNITQYTGSGNGVDAESTKDITGIIYKVPAGAKPKGLNLFFEGTRVTVAVSVE